MGRGNCVCACVCVCMGVLAMLCSCNGHNGKISQSLCGCIGNATPQTLTHLHAGVQIVGIFYTQRTFLICIRKFYFYFFKPKIDHFTLSATHFFFFCLLLNWMQSKLLPSESLEIFIALLAPF